MKKLLMACMLMSSAFTINTPVNAAATWAKQSPEQVERGTIMLEIARINEYFAAIGGDTRNCSGRTGAIIQYLKSVGTPVAYKICQEMVASGQLPKSALK